MKTKMKVVWSSKSKRDLFRVIDHLYEKWTENEVNQFQHSLENLIENLKMNSFNDKLKKELDKCTLLCSNCHIEEHHRLNSIKTCL